MPSTDRTASRRRLLEAVPAVAALGVAGCLNRPDADDGASPRTGSGPGGSTTTTDPSSQPQSAAGVRAWPQFGADARNTGHGDTVGPGAGAAAVDWRHDAGTPTMNSSPVVADDTVYALGTGDPGYVHAVDAASGDRRWTFEPAGYASAAPALDDDTLYLGTWGKAFHAIDAETGEQRWRADVGHRFNASSPTVVDGTVYVGTIGDGPLVVSGDDDAEFEAGAVLALDADNGAERWRYDEFGAKENVESSPAVVDGVVYVCAEGVLYALDADTGDVVWTVDRSTGLRESPAVVDGVVYSAGRTDAGDTCLQAVDATNGDVRWTTMLDDQNFKTSPAVADGTAYVAASSQRICTRDECNGVTRGQLYAIDATTGDRAWTVDITTDTRSSPAVADGIVYVGCRDGLSAVTTDGEHAWRVNFESDREDGPYVQSSPAVADGRVYVGASDGRLRAIHEPDGA